MVDFNGLIQGWRIMIDNTLPYDYPTTLYEVLISFLSILVARGSFCYGLLFKILNILMLFYNSTDADPRRFIRFHLNK